MRALVIGGTGFIGRRIVSNLLRADCDVTIATSGRTVNPFGKRVNTIVFDRFETNGIGDRISPAETFDVLFDQLSFGPDDVGRNLRIFRGKIQHYVFTSSKAVYTGSKMGFLEEDFDPTIATVEQGDITTLGYAEGKRGAEAQLFQNAPFSVSAARLPIVLGPDDSTERFQFHVNRVMEEKRIVIPAECGRMNYIWVEDAGRFLAWLGLEHMTGTYNAGSSYTLDANELVFRMGLLLNKMPRVLREGEEDDTSPYFFKADSSVDATKAESSGFSFTRFEEWFPDIVRRSAESSREPEYDRLFLPLTH